ncbi:MAG: SurA N-terminal domain-containing protein [Nanobdellota archaeon]
MAKSRNLILGVLVVTILAIAGCSPAEQQTTEQEGPLDQESPGEQTSPEESPSPITGEAVATVNGEEITNEEVTAMRQSAAQQRQNLSSEDALEQAINNELLSQKVEEEGYTVTDKEAEEQMESQLAQQGASLEDFKAQLEERGMSFQDQLDSLKEQLAMQQFIDDNVDVNVSEQEAQEYYQMYKQQASGEEEIGSYEEVKPQIMSALEQQKMQKETESLLKELREEAEINYN